MSNTSDTTARRLSLNRPLIVLGVAVALGGCGAYLANTYIKEEIASAKAQLGTKESLVQVVVPRKDIPRGARVRPEDMAVRELPASYVHNSAVTEDNFQVAEGQRLSYDAEQGKPLLWAHLDGGRTPTFSGRVPEGLRALTFPVDQISSISGFLQPKDKIDLMLTYRPGKEEITLPMLDGVLVLATGTRTVVDKGGDGGETERTYSTVTVQVTPEDAKRIILAQEAGKLTAVLRHPDDAAELPKTAMTVAKLAGTPPTPVRKNPLPPKVEVKKVDETKPSIQFIIGGV